MGHKNTTQDLSRVVENKKQDKNFCHIQLWHQFNNIECDFLFRLFSFFFFFQGLYRFCDF